jgi:hypothetical protein
VGIIQLNDQPKTDYIEDDIESEIKDEGEPQ